MTPVFPRVIQGDFRRQYRVQLLDFYLPVNPGEKLHQIPAQLEEPDRSGVYLRVIPESGNTWTGFFALGFDSDQVASGIYSCPDPNSLCVAVGGYVYVVDTRDPQRWLQVEQRPVVEIRPLSDIQLVIFIGFTSITGLEKSGRIWVTEQLSWEGLTVVEIQGETLHGRGWDVITGKEAPFEVDLLTGKSLGGARPHKPPNQAK